MFKILLLMIGALLAVLAVSHEQLPKETKTKCFIIDVVIILLIFVFGLFS